MNLSKYLREHFLLNCVIKLLKLFNYRFLAKMSRSLPLLAVLLGLVAAQTPGATPEVHPTLQTWECTKAGGCVSKTSQLVMDALAHPIHQKDNPALGCTDGTAVNKTVCPDEATCAQNCIVEGISDYSKHGVTTNGSSLLLKQLLDGQTVSPRVYLLDEAGDKYEMLQLTGREFSFVVDGSKLPCGMNGALYLSEMEASGGKSENNTAGAA
jgi:cellulase